METNIFSQHYQTRIGPHRSFKSSGLLYVGVLASPFALGCSGKPLCSRLPRLDTIDQPPQIRSYILDVLDKEPYIKCLILGASTLESLDTTDQAYNLYTPQLSMLDQAIRIFKPPVQKNKWTTQKRKSTTGITNAATQKKQILQIYNAKDREKIPKSLPLNNKLITRKTRSPTEKTKSGFKKPESVIFWQKIRRISLKIISLRLEVLYIFKTANIAIRMFLRIKLFHFVYVQN